MGLHHLAGRGRRPRMTIALLLTLTTLLLACARGTGPVVHETRDVRPFSRLEVGSGITVLVHLGSTMSLDVGAQQEILPAIVTDVSGDTLHIEADQDLVTTQRSRSR